MLYRFSDFEADPGSFELRKGGKPHHVEPLVFDLIIYLAENAGDVVSRDALIENVWNGRIVSEATIASCIKSARRALDQPGCAKSCIQTVRGRGFRFTDDVSVFHGDANAERTRPPTATPAPGRPVIAILPFTEPSDSTDLIADGVVAEITSALSRCREFRVIARQSAVAASTAQLDHRTIASQLGANYLLDGAIRRSGSRVRINVQLVESDSAHTVWSARFDDNIDDLFALEDRIARKVAGQLAPNLRNAEINRVRDRSAAERSAYDLVLMAYPQFWAHRPECNTEAVKLFDQAIDKDPGYALALALKGWAMAQHASYLWSVDPVADRKAAVASAEKAVLLVDNEAQTLVAIGAALTLASVDLPRAGRYIAHALELDPNNAWGWMRRGWLNIHLGNLTQALVDFDHADQLSPIDPFRFNMAFGRAIAHEHLGNIDRAIELAEEGLQTGAGVKWAYRLLSRFYMKNGNEAAARWALKKLVKAYPGLTISFIRKSLPPAITGASEDYFADLRTAGLPED